MRATDRLPGRDVLGLTRLDLGLVFGHFGFQLRGKGLNRQTSNEINMIKH